MSPISRYTSKTRKASAADEEVVSIYNGAIGAIEENNLLEFSILLEQNDLPNLFDKDSLGSLLLRACETNAKLDIITAILSLGPNINYFNKEQSSSCLMIATKNANQQLVSLLIQVGAKLNNTDRFGWTALFYASYFGCVNCAKLLLESGAQVNLVDSDEMTCLIWASGRGHHGVVEQLLEHGAQVNAPDRYNTSALIWASRKGNAEIVKTLIQNGAKVDERGMYGWTPLIVAVKGNHLETCKLLLSHKPNLNTCDGEKMSPLMIACREGFTEVALELIEEGSSVNQPDGHGNTALIHAVMAECHHLVGALIKAGAIVEYLGQDERNAVHWSVIRNDVRSCKLLLDSGADVTFTTTNGETYLMLAAKHRSWEVIQLLLEYNGGCALDLTKNKGINLCLKQNRDQRLIQALLTKSINCKPKPRWQDKTFSGDLLPINDFL